MDWYNERLGDSQLERIKSKFVKKSKSGDERESGLIDWSRDHAINQMTILQLVGSVKTQDSDFQQDHSPDFWSS